MVKDLEKSKHYYNMQLPDGIKYFSQVTKQKPQRCKSEAETCEGNGQVDKRKGEG